MGFSIKSAIRFGWETFKKRPRLFIGAALLLFVANIIIEVLGHVLDNLSADLNGVPLLAAVLVSIAVYLVLMTLYAMGAMAFGLAAHDNPNTVELSALWHPDPFWKILSLLVLYCLAILAMVLLAGLIGSPESDRVLIVATLFFVVFGVILMVLFIFAGFFVIDREASPIDALKESYRITNGNWWSILGLMLLLALMNFLGAFAFLAGFLLSLPGILLVLVFIVGLVALLITVPVSLLALTHAYRVLSGTNAAPSEPAADAKAA